MSIALLCGIGVSVAVVKGKLMARGFYGAFDDLLWGMLGAFYGDFLSELAGISSQVAWLLATSIGAAALLFLTGRVPQERAQPSPVRTDELLFGSSRKALIWSAREKGESGLLRSRETVQSKEAA